MIFTLVKNELIKMFKRSKTIIVFVLFLVCMFLFMYIDYYDYSTITESSSEWSTSEYEESKKSLEETLKKEDFSEVSEEDIIEQIKYLQIKIDQENGKATWKDEAEFTLKRDMKELAKTTENEEKKYLQEEIEVLQYCIDNNVEKVDKWDFNCGNFSSNFMNNVGTIILAVGIAVFLSDIVSGESTPPNLKFLIVQPVSRGKILLSKFIASIISVVTLIGGAELLAFLGLGIAKGFEILKQPVIIGQKYNVIIDQGAYEANGILGSGHIVSMGEFLIQAFLFQLLFIITVSAFIILLSTLCKSSMTSMAVSTVSILVISIISLVSPSVSSKIAHLVFLNYGTTPKVIVGDAIRSCYNEAFTVQNGIIVCIVTIIICYIISSIKFRRKDILI